MGILRDCRLLVNKPRDSRAVVQMNIVRLKLNETVGDIELLLFHRHAMLSVNTNLFAHRLKDPVNGFLDKKDSLRL